MSDFGRHRGPVTSVAGVPGRRAAVSTGYDSAVAWVDLEQQTLELLGYHRHLVNAVTVRADGLVAATSSSDYTVCLWDLETHTPTRLLRGHGDDVNAFAFIGRERGASVSHDQRVYVWDLETGAVTRILEGHQKYAMSIDYADGRLYSSGDDMTMRQWDAGTGELLKSWGPFEVETDSCAVDPLNRRIVLGADDGAIRIFDIDSGQLVREIDAHRSGIKRVAVSPITGNILSAAYDQRLLIWDAATFELETELESLPGTWERSINWTPDGGEILAGTFDGTVVVWDAASGRLTMEIGARGDGEGNLCFNDVSANAAGEVAAVSDDGYLRLLTLTPERAAVTAKVAPASGRLLMNGVTLDDASGLVVAGAHDQKLHIFRRRGRELTPEIEVDLAEGPINSVRIAHHPGYEGEIFVATYHGATVRLSSEGEIRGRFRLNDGAVKALCLHPTEPLGISCSADGGAVSWTFEGEVVERYLGHVAIADDIDIDPTGELVATVSRDFTLKVYAVRTGRLVAARSLGQRSPKSICFWDRDTVLVGNYWGHLFRFDLAGDTVASAEIASNGLSSLTRSGRHVVASSYDGGVYLIDPSDLSVVNTLRAMRQKLEGVDAIAL